MNDTIEYNLFKLLKDRQKMFDSLFDESKASIFTLSKRQFTEML